MNSSKHFPLWGVVGLFLVLIGFYGMDIGFALDAIWAIACGCAFVFIGLVVSIL